jgi:selenocysteine lyase/cysteine desulfurase
MEHHSNQTSWLETIATVQVIPADEQGLFCMENLKALLDKFSDRDIKIASITSCSNVTGIKTPYYEVARMMHQHNGVCFVDFACSGPYIDIDMHPEGDPEASLDAIFLSPHKFLGGPGSSGVLVFNRKLYKNLVPDCPGGGTVDWTTPWGTHKYIEDIELREDGGTPGFLQVIRTALAMRLKEKMGVDKIMAREEELLDYIFATLPTHKDINILAGQHRDRLGVISFTIADLHHDLAVKILNDRFGIQTRGGCSCAGTYGHYLLEIDHEKSDSIINQMAAGNLLLKPGWIRLSIHPTTTDEELRYVCQSILQLADNHKDWAKDYRFVGGVFCHVTENGSPESPMKEAWFEL